MPDDAAGVQVQLHVINQSGADNLPLYIDSAMQTALTNKGPRVQTDAYVSASQQFHVQVGRPGSGSNAGRVRIENPNASSIRDVYLWVTGYWM